MLTVTRQDAWNHEEDLILAEVVLRHIREGSTQLAAFEEVGERLSRTTAACGFRWNSLVRKNYQSAISLAKKQRKQLKQEAPKPSPADYDTKKPVLSLDDVIDYLERFRSTEQDHERMLQDNERLRAEVDRLKEENTKLKHDVNDTRKENQSIQDDYKALIAIMERARKLAVFHDDDSEIADSHGDLQKVDK